MRAPAVYRPENSGKRKTCALLLGIACMVMAACDSGQPDAHAATAGKQADEAATQRRQALSAQAAQLFGPLPAPKLPDNEARIDLGRMLYFDPRLSRAGDISCNSCHKLNNLGVDNEPLSPGHEDRQGKRNSPTVYNAALHTTQFWDGRAANLTEQVKSHILSPLGMAMASEGRVVAVLAAVPAYVELFQTAFPNGNPAMSFDNTARAIASFEEGLITPDRFDAFMLGDLQALSDPEINGLELFIQTGCASCHNGPVLGGNSFRKMGLVKPYPSGDPGRHEVTGNEEDKAVFKVPGLRNIAKTAPYLHDGSITRLVDSIHIMAEYQLGRELSDADAASIAMFLESLTGTPNPDYIAEPEMPEVPARSSPRDPG